MTKPTFVEKESKVEPKAKKTEDVEMKKEAVNGVSKKDSEIPTQRKKTEEVNGAKKNDLDKFAYKPEPKKAAGIMSFIQRNKQSIV